MISQGILHEKYYGHDLLDSVINGQSQSYPGIYYATVISDPSTSVTGAVRVKVHGIFDGDGASDIADDVLPWAVPAPNICFRVPKKGTQILVYFKNDDIYFPVYISQAADISSHNPGKETGTRSSYPNHSLLFTDQKDFRLAYDSDKNELLLNLPNNVYCVIDDKGKITYNVPEGVDGGTPFPVITEKSVDIWTARKMDGRGTKYMNVSHSKPNFS